MIQAKKGEKETPGKPCLVLVRFLPLCPLVTLCV
jgi:hypothetical protein